MEAMNNLVDLYDDYQLAQEQIDTYQRDGHICLRNVLAPGDLEGYRKAIVDAVVRYNQESRPLEERDTYGKAFLQVMNLWVRDDAVRRFVTAHRFAKIAAELMGVDGVRIYHDQALFKEPGGGYTPWHQDQNYWPLDTNKTITMWMPLVDVPEDVGSMTFVSESHKNGRISKEVISDNSQTFFERFISDHDMKKTTHGAMAAGDATFHSGWTLHSAPGNPTSQTREVMTIIYMADDTRVSVPASTQENDLATWLPGMKPGDIAASSINPLVYRRRGSE